MSLSGAISDLFQHLQLFFPSSFSRAMSKASFPQARFAGSRRKAASNKTGTHTS